MTDNRTKQVNIRFTERGLRVLDEKRKQVPRSDYVRQALAYAIKMGFVPKETL